jgi:membrane protease YdiL (CAAX protease family)
MQRYRRLTGSIPVIRSTREKHCSRISAVARVAFHIYYGPTSVFILVWAVGVVLLYRATGRVLGIIAAHALWDLYAALGGRCFSSRSGPGVIQRGATLALTYPRSVS